MRPLPSTAVRAGTAGGAAGGTASPDPAIAGLNGPRAPAAGEFGRDRLARLLYQVTKMARGLQFTGGLNPAQWDCLRFIGRANTYSRTPGAIAAMLGTTKGTASQTIITLENKGYVRRERDGKDKRIRKLALTADGRALLRRDPLACISDATTALTPDAAATAAAALETVLQKLTEHCGRAPFGICAECGHLRPPPTHPDPEQPARCNLLGCAITAPDREKICISFQAARPGTATGRRDA